MPQIFLLELDNKLDALEVESIDVKVSIVDPKADVLACEVPELLPLVARAAIVTEVGEEAA